MAFPTSYTMSGTRQYDETEIELTDPTYTPFWVDKNHLRERVGLSDATIEQLVQEDTGFRRRHGNRVEYDMNKVYTHPKVLAFLEEIGNAEHFIISYEQLIRN